MYLAQANIARMKGPIDSPIMKEFADQLEAINGVADEHPGFVWRLQTEEGDATAIRAFEDEKILFNMSVWKSIEDLFDYTYGSAHVEPFRNRAKWFDAIDLTSSLVLWWVDEDHIPSIEEAKQKLALLEEQGPCPQAFTFKKRFNSNGQEITARGRS